VRSLALTKCQAAGNDFLLLDARDGTRVPFARWARVLCRRRFSIGADGLLILQPPRRTGCVARLRVFNADGTEAEVSGNGLRCAALYVYQRHPQRRRFDFDTQAGIRRAGIVRPGPKPSIDVDMGVPRVGAPRNGVPYRLRVQGRRYEGWPVALGNPHVVVFIDADPAEQKLEDFVAALHEARGRRDVNLELVRAAGRTLFMRVHERGVGETLACGSGACAAAAAAIALGKARSPVPVRMPGGEVRVTWPGPGLPAVLSGSAQIVFRTQISLAELGASTRL
jgi:diaminopimelate epimerase